MTAQQPDHIDIDGEPWLLLATPFDEFVRTRRLPPFTSPHTANWRGYVAAWRIHDGWLSLEEVTAWVEGPDGGPAAVAGAAATGGVALPVLANWVTGQLRVASGAVVRHVHGGFESRWEREVLLDVQEGRVTGRTELAAPGAMGTAGPYRLHEPLLGDLSGGAFGQVIRASDLDGKPLVAKAARPNGGGGPSATEMWVETPEGRRPIHVPAVALRHLTGGGLAVEAVDAELVRTVLVREAELLERDGGMVLPRSYGLWDHDPSGTPVLVMELLEGRKPSSATDVLAILDAVADAVRRGVFDAHGDIKLEHVFIESDQSVRLCDPAPRLDPEGRRAFTPLYNPRGFAGPAADVAACATILRYLPRVTEGWRWCAAVLDEPTPPPWVHDHAAAAGVLSDELDTPTPPPVGWTPPPLPGRVAGFRAAPVRAPAPPSPPPTTRPGPLPPVPSVRSVDDILGDTLAEVQAVRAVLRFRAPAPLPSSTRELLRRLKEEVDGLHGDAP